MVMKSFQRMDGTPVNLINLNRGDSFTCRDKQGYRYTYDAISNVTEQNGINTIGAIRVRQEPEDYVARIEWLTEEVK